MYIFGGCCLLGLHQSWWNNTKIDPKHACAGAFSEDSFGSPWTHTDRHQGWAWTGVCKRKLKDSLQGSRLFFQLFIVQQLRVFVVILTMNKLLLLFFIYMVSFPYTTIALGCCCVPLLGREDCGRAYKVPGGTDPSSSWSHSWFAWWTGLFWSWSIHTIFLCHWITEWLSLQGASGDHLAQPSCSSRATSSIHIKYILKKLFMTGLLGSIYTQTVFFLELSWKDPTQPNWNQNPNIPALALLILVLCQPKTKNHLSLFEPYYTGIVNISRKLNLGFHILSYSPSIVLSMGLCTNRKAVFNILGQSQLDIFTPFSLQILGVFLSVNY